MSDRQRYTFRDVPEPLTVPLSFRVPGSVGILLEDRVAKLVEAGEIRNRTDALADALVTWLMVEEHHERQAAVDVEGT